MTQQDAQNGQDNLAQILKEYGQAMVRVGQLENELALAKQDAQIQRQDNSPVKVQPQKEVMDLELKLEGREQDLVALRLQLETTQAELTETKNKLKLAAEGNYIRHRKNKEKRSGLKRLLMGRD